jgi:hypothetical protein
MHPSSGSLPPGSLGAAKPPDLTRSGRNRVLRSALHLDRLPVHFILSLNISDTLTLTSPPARLLPHPESAQRADEISNHHYHAPAPLPQLCLLIITPASLISSDTVRSGDAAGPRPSQSTCTVLGRANVLGQASQRLRFMLTVCVRVLAAWYADSASACTRLQPCVAVQGQCHTGSCTDATLQQLRVSSELKSSRQRGTDGCTNKDHHLQSLQ